MLCPEVWNFAPPAYFVNNKTYESDEEVFDVVKNQYFNHCVSITLPNTLNIPDNITSTILEDSQYYRINKVSPVEFFKEDFIKLFVHKGQLTAISISSELEQDDSFAFAPNGKIILVLSRNSYQELGVEAEFRSSIHSLKKNIVVIDLSSDTKQLYKKCEKIEEKLTNFIQLHFDIVLAWEPTEAEICPSSIAFYFSKKGYEVKVCDLEYNSRHSYNVKVPIFDDESDAPDLIEWLGAFALECDVPHDNHISTMVCPEKHEMFGQVIHLKFTGLIPISRIKRLIHEIRKYVTEKGSSNWISLVVQGFEDSPVQKKKGNFLQNFGDHHHTIIFKHNSPSFVSSFSDVDKYK